jgi:hypothetical protein
MSGPIAASQRESAATSLLFLGTGSKAASAELLLAAHDLGIDLVAAARRTR